MAKYSDIKGFTVQTLASDTAASGIAGATWASGGNLNTGRFQSGRVGAGTQTAGLLSGGDVPPASATSEYYDGSSWSEQADLNTARGSHAQGGIQTSSLVTGGSTELASTEEWNGSAWTEVNDLNTGRRQLGMSTNGNAEGAIAFAGYAPPTGGPVGYTGRAEEWNGSSWTETADLNTPRSSLTGTDASSTAALAIGGYRGPPTADRTKFVEEWNGSAWTEIADINNERMDLGCGGSYTDCIIFGGIDGPTAASPSNTEHWDGSSWTEIAELSTGRYGIAGTGSTPAALAMGGTTGTTVTSTEEFTVPSVFSQITEGQLYFNSTTNTFKETISDVPGTSWSSGPAVNSTKSFNNGAGDLTSAITFGGAPSPTQAYSEQWNGSTWTEVSDLNEGRQAGSAGGASGTDAIMGGGYEGPNVSNSVNTEIWDGSSWTEVNNLNTQKYTAGSGIPVSTSGVAFGGNPYVANTEVWDGTNWTEVADLNTARMYLAGFGSATSAIAGNGIDPSASPPTYLQNKVEKWDGTSWTEVSEFNTARSEMLQGQGSSNASGIMSGGSTTGSNQIANTELWNGSSWTELNDLGTAKRMGAQIGSTSSGMYIAGQAPSPSTSVEHWNSPLANKTITAS